MRFKLNQPYNNVCVLVGMLAYVEMNYSLHNHNNQQQKFLFTFFECHGIF